MIKLLAWMLMFTISLCVLAQDAQVAVPQAKDDGLFKKASTLFAQGKYLSTIEELKTLEVRLLNDSTSSRSNLGLIYYWKGMTHNRLQEYTDAIANFDKALGHDYSPLDLNYEYGQALFAADKLEEARLQFKESLNKKFKRGVSLYYIAFVSKELGDKKKALTFFQAVDKLEKEEAAEVQQAAEMQIADIYLEQVESGKDAFKGVEQYVIPQYERAFKVDEESPLAPQIKEKIVNLQRKYELILFNLRNGRPTLNPPYFLRVSQEISDDSNVTFSPTETTISKSKQSSMYSKTDVIGRYTLYLKNFMSFAPELRMNNTYYFNRVPEIYRNDNRLFAPALRTAYEHTLWEKQASTLFDYEYSYAQRDVNAKEKLEFSSRSNTFMLGERFNFFASGETILRIRKRAFTSYASASNSNTTSFVLEQIKSIATNTLIIYFSYDQTRVKNEAFDTNAMTLRTDLIMARVKDWFTPSVGLSLTSTDPINNRAARGQELLINPNTRITKTFGKSFRVNLKYEYQKNKSEDTANFAFKKQLYGMELEYLF